MTTTVRSCPRCTRDYAEEMPAVSRATPSSDIEICGPCGGDEVTGRGIVLVVDWPIPPSPDEPVPTNAFREIEVGDTVVRRSTLPGGQQFSTTHQVVEVQPDHIVDSSGDIARDHPDARWTIVLRSAGEDA